MFERGLFKGDECRLNRMNHAGRVKRKCIPAGSFAFAYHDPSSASSGQVVLFPKLEADQCP